MPVMQTSLRCDAPNVTSVLLLAVAARLEQWDVHVVGLVGMTLEHHLYRQSAVHVVDRAVHDVGREPYVGLLLDLDDRDDVGRFRTRHPGLVVDGVRSDRGAPRHGLGLEPLRMALGADRLRWVDEVSAVL